MPSEHQLLLFWLQRLALLFTVRVLGGALRAVGLSASEEILALARETHADLLVLAANLRQFTGRPFLGHGVEYLLEQAPSTVVVVTAPPGWGPPSVRR